ncbi:MAG: acyl-CoA dehydrogenase family protein [Chloroflexi bacterium]|nr:acyl-CoA dehydrogenase family protein [Chloroflexota bacterium]
MEFGWSKEDQAFRREVDDFLEAEIPSWWKGMFSSGERGWEYTKEFCQKIGERGWLTMAWPKEYGGADAPIWTQVIFKEALARYGEPRGPQYMNLNWIGPSLMLFGTEEQKKYHLDRISKGDVLWCQGFSEPDAGSDLASLQCRAVEDGDEYVINGQKIWTSYAERAEFCFLLTRTNPDAPKHRGISVFLLEMDTPGITVRPIQSMGGFGDINEVFFDNVRVPRSKMLGQKDEGWQVITAALNFERIGQPRYEAAKDTIDHVIKYAKETKHDGITLAKDPVLRQKIADVYTHYRAARVLNYRLASMVAKEDTPGPGPSSLTRIHNILMTQRAANLAMEVLGPYGLLRDTEPEAPMGGLLEYDWRKSISATIAAGTLEIQKEQVAVRGLGIPR